MTAGSPDGVNVTAPSMAVPGTRSDGWRAESPLVKTQPATYRAAGSPIGAAFPQPATPQDPPSTTSLPSDCDCHSDQPRAMGGYNPSAGPAKTRHASIPLPAFFHIRAGPSLGIGRPFPLRPHPPRPC